MTKTNTQKTEIQMKAESGKTERKRQIDKKIYRKENTNRAATGHTMIQNGTDTHDQHRHA